MKKKYIFLMTTFAGLLFLAFYIQESHISKYFEVEDKVLYRSSQPDIIGFLFLKNKGIKSVVNFRDDRSDSQWLLEMLGVDNYLNLKVEDRNPPSKKQVEQFINFVTDSKNQPVLMHCRSGKGRTGTFEVLYHNIVEGKPIKESIRETTLANKISDIQIEWLQKIAKSGTFRNDTQFNHKDGSKS